MSVKIYPYEDGSGYRKVVTIYGPQGDVLDRQTSYHSGTPIENEPDYFGRKEAKLTAKQEQRRLFLEMIEGQNGRCIYCGCAFDVDDVQKKPTLEHLLPLSRGGTSQPENLAVSCHRCNQDKSDRTHEEYLESLKSN